MGGSRPGPLAEARTVATRATTGDPTVLGHEVVGQREGLVSAEASVSEPG